MITSMLFYYLFIVFSTIKEECNSMRSVKRNLFLLGFVFLSYGVAASASLAQRNLRLATYKTEKKDPFIGKWRWSHGTVRVVTADRIYEENDSNWSGKWERISDGEKYKFNFGTPDNPNAYVVIGTLNENGTFFEGMNQDGKAKERAVKIDD